MNFIVKNKKRKHTKTTVCPFVTLTLVKWIGCSCSCLWFGPGPAQTVHRTLLGRIQGDGEAERAGQEMVGAGVCSFRLHTLPDCRRLHDTHNRCRRWWTHTQLLLLLTPDALTQMRRDHLLNLNDNSSIHLDRRGKSYMYTEILHLYR